MEAEQMYELLENYRKPFTVQSWKREPMFEYENAFIKLLRVDSSNKSGGAAIKNGKQWSIIFQMKQNFTHLPNWCSLVKRMRGDMRLTPVNTGVLAGNFAIRIYNMAQNPEEGIVRNLLDFIFG